ncbi:hypothetical protein [Micromonospora oryzae]|uniref:hypothetical protein n=1 Tax=Micromonospora sp. DSM 102119 TaxID=3111768 RepID=UPI0031D3C57C
MRDIRRLAEIGRHHYLSKVNQELGQAGIDDVKVLHPCLKRIYSAIDYESIKESLTLFKLLDGEVGPLDIRDARVVDDPLELAVFNKGALTLQILPENRLAVWEVSTDPAALQGKALAYVYDRKVGERFWVNGVLSETSVQVGYPLFAAPLFYDLHAALKTYAVMHARSSECPILVDAWREPARVMWRPKPEAIMRKSLYHFLRISLRDGRPDIQQEALADDQYPVDITVRWAESNRIGIVEIKWLGKSGDLDPPRVTKTYSEGRAADGLRQLVDYLELTKVRAPLFDRRGYLVVFDGRRARVRPETAMCERSHGMAYENKNITYDPTHLARHDIAEPVRCFCEPRWVHASPSGGH